MHVLHLPWKLLLSVYGQDYLAKCQFGKYKNITRGEGQHLSDMTNVVLCIIVVLVLMEVPAPLFQNAAKPKNLINLYFDYRYLNNRLFHPIKDAFGTETVTVQTSRMPAL